MGTRRSYEPGPTAHRVRVNLAELRRHRRVSLRALSKRLELLGHPLLASGLSKIETGARRADVDDLVAFAIALDVSPNRLLLTGTAGEERVELTPEAEASERTGWHWATGETALPVDLWADESAADLDRARRFKRENRPHDHSGETSIDDLEKHQAAMAPAVKACKEAVKKSGLPHEDVLNYITLAFRLEEFGRAIERGGSGKRR